MNTFKVAWRLEDGTSAIGKWETPENDPLVARGQALGWVLSMPQKTQRSGWPFLICINNEQMVVIAA